MSEDSRWSIQELLARYELEPGLADIFVEGSFDRDVLGHLAHGRGDGSTFYEIGNVDVPPDLLAKHGLSSGNKQRLIVLSRELSSLTHDTKVACLIDRDLDHWFGKVENTLRLKWTTFCDLESHFLTLGVISDVAIKTCRAKITNFDKFAESLYDTLRLLYALRLADRELSSNLTWVSLRKYLKIKDGVIAFENKKYIVATLGSNAKSSLQSKFETASLSWHSRLVGDIRLSSRGHDYTTVLAWAISELGGQKEIATGAAIERIFVLLASSVKTINTELA